MDKTSSMYLYVKLNWDANRFLPAESSNSITELSNLIKQLSYSFN